MRKRLPLITATLSSLCIIVLILDTKTALLGATEGITLCIRTVIPSLFPFFLFSILFVQSMGSMSVSAFRFLARLLRIPEGAEMIFLTGVIGGYPVGAQSIAQAFHNGSLSKADSERMLSFCVNAGPAFLFGIGATILDLPGLCWICWSIHILSAVLVGCLTPGKARYHVRKSTHFTLSPAVALKKAVQTMAIVCGWVILFRVVLAFADRWFLWLFPNNINIILYGLTELSNGCCNLMELQQEEARFLFLTLFINFGGGCVAMQVLSIASECGLSVKGYLPGKILQSSIGVFLCRIVQKFYWGISWKSVVFSMLFSVGCGIIYRTLIRKMQKNSSNLTTVVV